MAAITNGDARSYGKFHPKCQGGVTLSEDRRIASGKPSIFGAFPIAFSNDKIPIGIQFSVKTLQQDPGWVSPISTSSRPHTSDAPYTGAVGGMGICGVK